MVIALYRLDSAYFERIGGILTFILIHHKEWVGKNKADRVKFLKILRNWWNEKDMRERYKDLFRNFFDYVIDCYEKREFYTKSIDFLMDWHIAHGVGKPGEENKDVWLVPNDQNGLQIFDPANWYPRGKGQVNYLLHHSSA